LRHQLPHFFRRNHRFTNLKLPLLVYSAARQVTITCPTDPIPRNGATKAATSLKTGLQDIKLEAAALY
jgi:hypothetical protein